MDHTLAYDPKAYGLLSVPDLIESNVDQMSMSMSLVALIKQTMLQAMFFKLGCLIVQCQYVTFVDLGIIGLLVKGIMPLIPFPKKHHLVFDHMHNQALYSYMQHA